jgi:hypothetical protein
MNRAAPLSLLLMLAACSKAIDQPSSASLDNSEQQQMQRSIDETTMAVRLKAAEARIVALERQVGALEATPEKIDLQLVTQRLEQLEAKVYARAPVPDGTATPVAAPRPADQVPRPTPSPSPAPNRFNPFGL